MEEEGSLFIISYCEALDQASNSILAVRLRSIDHLAMVFPRNVWWGTEGKGACNNLLYGIEHFRIGS